jgi:DNA-binding MarR family transcriptional regulator
MSGSGDGGAAVPLSMPGLLRAAQQVYALEVRDALAAAGSDDTPRNGSYVISASARRSTPLSAIIERLGLSKQAAGQLVDNLVARGYLERAVDPDDRRRLVVTLTNRGRAAAAVIRAAVDRVDAELEARLGQDRVAAARAVLAAIPS